MKVIRYRCLNLKCNHTFKKEVASKEEAEDAAKQGREVIPVICPKCRSINVARDY